MTTQGKRNGVDLYTWATPNGRKISIMLEELELPYSVFPIDITKGEQHVEEFLALSPNNKIPAIVDHENGIRLMESGAILMYLAHKTGKLMSPIGEKFWKEMEWLMLQMGSIGPMLGQTHHFVKFNPGKSSYAEDRWVLVKQIDRSFQGITQGLSKHGALLVKRGEGWVEEVLAGDIIEWDKKVISS